MLDDRGSFDSSVMASYQDLERDWSALPEDVEEWIHSDLQLAAELGKTLLERNKELEISLKQHQNIIEDQAQEIEYLTKQTVALREVNDSRLKIYEQLEISVQDLERANHRLALEHTSDKKHIKSLTGTIESLESKCEDLQKNADELTRQLDVYKRRAERQNELQEKLQKSEASVQSETITKGQPDSLPTILKPREIYQEVESACEEELLKVHKELSDSRLMQIKEQRKIAELEEQLAAMVQENNKLQDKLKDWNQNDDVMKSMHEEFSILEEVRQGQLCGRCLRNVEQATDDMSSMMDAEEEDDRSVMSSLVNEPRALGPHKLVQLQGQHESVQGWSNSGDNPYRDLVEKYEALVEVQRHQANNIKKCKQPSLNMSTPQNNSGPLSLQEELQMSGDFNHFSIKDTDEESGHGDEANKSLNPQSKSKKSIPGPRKTFTRTPDFSEAETSSSGFSDETSNKATQTDRERPGSFLCTIADGEDCRFSIYDDGSPIDSRFRNRPEYRELFKEIFTILKKAAENKDEGEKLPLLDDTTPMTNKVPPVTPATEDLPGDFTDDTQSVMSSAISEQSVPMSDITPPEKLKEKENLIKVSKDLKKLTEKKNSEEEKSASETPGEPQRVLTPLIRQPLDFMTASPQFRKKTSRHKNRKHSQDRQGAESPVIPSPPKICYQRGSGSKKRRDYRPLEPSPLARSSQVAAPEWNGTTMQFFNRSLNSPTPSQNGGKITSYQRWNPETDSWDIKQSTASQEIHKLRRLELSYAEVLRNADKNKGRRRRHQ
ncbi:cerebellar degeneration-related protein 2-like isoform X3 [Arctopsyche grandis]|uniref:cerebellar degeneration-related protein 2-like isoform X3 n=1 Tax=Arctopsyche grandis TaxID=121162 RepID=UPI00406D8B08